MPQQSSRTSAASPTRIIPWLLTLCLLLPSALTQASVASIIEESGTHYSEALYRELVRDLQVKTHGGTLNIRRHWRKGQTHHNIPVQHRRTSHPGTPPPPSQPTKATMLG